MTLSMILLLTFAIIIIGEVTATTTTWLQQMLKSRKKPNEWYENTEPLHIAVIFILFSQQSTVTVVTVQLGVAKES